MKLGGETLTRMRAPLLTTGAAGRRARDWSAAVSVAFTGCSFQPLSTTEYISDREFAATHWKAIVPGRADFVSTDRVEWLGDSYEVDGDAEYWDDMKGKSHHTTFLCKRWQG